jgi:uncharacterized phiE125 gp8 family phage protein
MTPRVITQPTIEPLTMDEVSQQTKADIDPSLCDIFIRAARVYVEDRTGRAIHEQVLEVALDRWPRDRCIELPKATPLVEIVSVKYRDCDEVDHTMSPSDYVANDAVIPGRLVLAYNSMWPSVVLSPASPIRIQYKVGSDDPCPAELKYPILLLVAGMNENRESESVTNLSTVQAIAMTYGVEAFLSRAAVVPSSY